MKVTLFVIPGSHPGIAARLMLERKGIPYRRVDLPPALSRTLIRRVFGFAGDRTPAMKVDGRKVQGSTQISRELDAIQPEPPLFPADPERRRATEDIEHWGDGGFQDIPRKISWWALLRRKGDQASFLEDARLGLPTKVLVATSGPLVRYAMRLNQISDDVVREHLAKIPAALDQVDAWIAEGLLNGEELTAADYQIGTTVRLLMSFDDLEPAIAERPSAELARRVQPEASGRIGPVFPSEWLRPLEPAAA